MVGLITDSNERREEVREVRELSLSGSKTKELIVDNRKRRAPITIDWTEVILRSSKSSTAAPSRVTSPPGMKIALHLTVRRYRG